MANVRGIYSGPDMFSTATHYLTITPDTVTGMLRRTPNRTAGYKALAPDSERVDELSGHAGQRTAGATGTTRNLRGWYAEGFGDDVLFNQIYVELVNLSASPIAHLGTDYDVGFITEELSYAVLIWNSYLTLSKDLTSVTELNPDGTSITYPTLPSTISPGGELQLTLTIDELGPALQDTSHQFVIGGETHTTRVTGLRVMAMLPEPDWRSGINHVYTYQTAMFRTERFKEQRRALVDTPGHQTKVDFMLLDDEAKRFFYSLSYGHDKVFGVPIYNEIMTPTDTGLPQGSDTITVQDATSDMWNLNNTAEYIAIIDHTNSMAEIKEIGSIGANTIVCSQNISQLFDETTSRVYPVYFGLIKAASLKQRTDGIDTIKLDFLEFDNG